MVFVESEMQISIAGSGCSKVVHVYAMPERACSKLAITQSLNSVWNGVSYEERFVEGTFCWLNASYNEFQRILGYECEYGHENGKWRSRYHFARSSSSDSLSIDSSYSLIDWMYEYQNGISASGFRVFFSIEWYENISGNDSLSATLLLSHLASIFRSEWISHRWFIETLELSWIIMIRVFEEGTKTVDFYSKHPQIESFFSWFVFTKTS